MEINTLNSTVLDRGILETQNDIATSQEMQGGRRIQQQEAVVPAFQKMAITPGTSQRTILDHTATTATAENASCATTETASDGEPESPEITVQSGYQKQSTGFVRAVDKTYYTLRQFMPTNWNKKSNVFPFCMSVATNIQTLIHRKDIDHGNHLDVLKSKLAPLYTQSLNPALQFLQDQATAGLSWEYHEKMSLLARCLEFYSTNENEADDKAMLAQVYQQFVDNELHYLDCMKNSFLRYPCDHSLHIIDTLLSDDSPACRLQILEDDCIAKSREKAAQIREHRNNLLARQEGDTGKIQEEIEELKKKIHNGTSDTTIKRTYYEVLAQRIELVNQEWQKTTEYVSDQQLVDFITKLADYCEEQSMFLMEFTRLRNNLRSLLCNIGSHILVIIKDRPGNVAYLRDKSMNIIHRLNETNWLNEECKNLYVRCTQPQTAARTGRITDLQCQQQLRKIMSFMNRKSREDYLMAASMLQRFLNEHENELNMLYTARSLCASIKALKKTLHSELLLDLVIEWDGYISNKTHWLIIDHQMSRHRSTISQLNPYISVLLSGSAMYHWQDMACCAWKNDIDRISHQTSFNRNDVDILLGLRDVTQEVPNLKVRILLILGLIKIFQFVLQGEDVAIPVDKIAELSKWIDYLNQYYGGNHDPYAVRRNKLLSNLKNLNEQWKRKQSGTTNKGAMVPSNTPGKITPAFVHPGFLAMKQSTEVPDGPSCANRQIMSSEMMQPSTAHGYIPTPAAPWPSQQPATLVYGSPATQSPMAAELHPAPIRQFQPTHYGMPVPTPDNQSFCQQPATLVYGSPATQPPMAAGPYPAPIRQFQPAPCRTLTGNQLPIPAMMSHFSAHTHVQVCPSCCQFTACEPVQSQEQMATQQQYSVQPAISGHKPESSGNF